MEAWIVAETSNMDPVSDARQASAAPIAIRPAQGLAGLFFLLLLGDLAWSLKERSVLELAKAQLMLLNQNAVLLNVLFGALPALITLFVGPMVGAWSDRTRTRLGRRIPFLLATAPVVAAAIAGLAYHEPLGQLLARLAGSPAPRASASLMTMMLCWTVFESASLIGNTLFIALINDTVPRHLIGRFFGLFRIISLAVGAGFFYFVFRHPLPDILRPALLLIGAIYLGGFLLLCCCVSEPALPPPDAAAGAGAQLRQLAGSGANFYPLLLLGVAVAAVAVLPVNINSYNARAQFGVDQASFGAAIAVTYAISILLAWPLGWLADRYHPLYLGFAALTAYALAMLCAWLWMDGRNAFLAGLVVHGVLSGTFLTGTAALLPALLPRDRFSQLAALSGSMTALLTVAGSLAMGGLLDVSGRDFRLIFLAGGLLALTGSLIWYRLIRRYRRSAFATLTRTSDRRQ